MAYLKTFAPQPEFKVCTKCKIEKPIEEFHTRKETYTRLDGTLRIYIYTHSECKSCKSEYQKAYREKRGHVLSNRNYAY